MGTATLIAAEQLLAMPITLCRTATDNKSLSASAELDGCPLLPGFRCHIAGPFANE